MNEPLSNPFAVLFVDDEPQARKYFALGVQGTYRVLTAEGVDEGIDILAREGDAIGVLITDQRMPGKNGVEILRHARDNYPHIVRLLTTAYTDLGDAIDAVNKGEILRYISKPWKLDALLVEIRQAMSYFMLGLERDKLVAEKFALRRFEDRVQRFRDIALVGLTVPATRGRGSAMHGFMGDCVANGWAITVADTEPGEDWQWIRQRLQPSLRLGHHLQAWQLAPTAPQQRYSGADLAQALVQALGAGSVGVELASGAAEAAITASPAVLELTLGVLAEEVGGRGAPALAIELSVAAAGGLSVLVRLPPLAADGRDCDGLLRLLGLYLGACHHGGSCHINEDLSQMRLRFAADPGTPSDAGEVGGLEWLDDLLGELTLQVMDEE